MLWILLSALGAAANAGYFIVTKNVLATLDRNVLAAGSFLATGSILLVISLVRGIPVTGDDLVPAIIATTVLNIIGTTLVFRTLSDTDISLAIPMISFTPVFLIATSFFLLHEVPTVPGIAGIMIIVTGSYVLNISDKKAGFIAPFRSIVSNPGTASMLIVAFVYAVSINFDKMVVLNSDPVFGSSLVLLMLGVSFLIIGVLLPNAGRTTLRGKSAIPHGSGLPAVLDQYYSGIPVFAVLAILLTIEAVTINYAYTLQIAPYVIAIKRMSIIGTVLYGTLIAGERHVFLRLAGAATMVAGAILIIISA